VGYEVHDTTVTDKMEHLLPLLERQRDELEPGRDIAPALAAYEALENMNRLLAMLLVHDGSVVGYAIGYLGPHMHYTGMTYLHNDVLYVAPEHRGRAGVLLMRATERAARERGATMVSWSAKPDTPLERLLPSMGYGKFETIYTREL